MADFCKQCSEALLGEDFGELRGLCGEGQTVEVLCEGCGPTIVNEDGVCVNTTCLRKHGIQTPAKSPD